MERESAIFFPCRADKETTSCSDGQVNYFEFSGLDLLSKSDATFDDASDSSYSSYCNDSLQLSGVSKKTMQQRQQRRCSMDGAISNQSALTTNKIQRSASVKEMISWLSTGDEECEDDLDVESCTCLTMTKPIPLKHLDNNVQLFWSFSGDILASHAVAGGAGRAA